MTITRPPKEPGKQAPNHERYMANKSAGQLRRTSRRGFSTFVNALAFSTLLSSQETDAHHQRNLRSHPGQPLNLTLEFLSCQLRFRKLSGRLRRFHFGYSRHQGLPSVSQAATVLSKHCERTLDLRKLVPRWLPGSWSALRLPVPLGAR